MAPKVLDSSSGTSKSKNPLPLRQGTLSFTASKRAASTGSLNPKVKGAKALSARASSLLTKAEVPETIEIVSSSSEDESDFRNLEDEDAVPSVSRRNAGVESEEGEPALKRRRLRTHDEARIKSVFDSREGAENVDSQKDDVKGAKAGKGKPDLRDRTGRWRKHYGVVRTKMGNLKPIHAEEQTMIDHVLRVFDLSYEYGPCIGVTRLQRWERAEALGLNPPPEVKEILLTREGSDDKRFSQCVFYDEV
ncbi:hypothetical protein AcV5_009032 [Taiwanofungus camphoratus]|nr:hypothetical protein AcV5_009032 [Antrodia cinnamomea]KAI0924288.1 hypothetical protein AcW2_005209 [Antrodia cinnamomea]KAI0940864.1 hypothetical protein AcV7_003128 [Antrodia cinnamomea]